MDSSQSVSWLRHKCQRWHFPPTISFLPPLPGRGSLLREGIFPLRLRLCTRSHVMGGGAWCLSRARFVCIIWPPALMPIWNGHSMDFEKWFCFVCACVCVCVYKIKLGMYLWLSNIYISSWCWALVAKRIQSFMLHVSSWHLFGAYHVHSALQPLYYLMFTTIHRDGYHHLHFTGEKTEVQEV